MGKVKVSANVLALEKEEKKLVIKGQPLTLAVGEMGINKTREEKVKDAADDMII